MDILAGFLLAAAVLGCIALREGYSHLPFTELKRRTRQDKKTYSQLFRVRSFGSDIDLLLWLIAGVCTGVLFVVLVNSLSNFWAAMAIALSLWIGIFWAHQVRRRDFVEDLALVSSPVFAWLLPYVHFIFVPFKWLASWVVSWHTPTGLYEKEDILRLLNRQRQQSDNRISDEAMDIVEHALSYGDQLVRDIMTPQKKVTGVREDDHLGPVLLDELHKSGHSRFPVMEMDGKHAIGILYLHDLTDKAASGSVKSLMNSRVRYVHEELGLDHVLDAFLTTKQHLFLVVNRFEDVVGLITFEDVLEQLIGKRIIDEFDKYSDMAAVAELPAEKDRKQADAQVIE